MKVTLRRKIMLCAIAPICLLGAIVILISVTLVKASIIERVEDSLKGTAVATLAAYDQNSGNYLQAENGSIWKGNYNISQSEKVVDTIAEKSGMVVTFFYGSQRVMTSAIDKNGQRILGSPAGDKVVQKVLNGGENYFSENIRIENTTYFGYFVPVYQTGETTAPIGMIFAGINKNETMADALSIITLLIGVVVFVVIACVVVGCIVANSISKSLKSGISVVQQVSDGNLNVSISERDLKRRDEVGEMTRAIWHLQEELRKVIGGISESTAMLLRASDTLESTSMETFTDMNNVQGSVTTITEGATSQAKDTQNASYNIQKMGNIIIETGHEADGLNDRADRMIASSDRATASIDELKSINDQVRDVVEMIASQTKETNDSANRIKEAAAFISEIANQTNLLSLNASIEAARAGESGRGFAVVAQEIQKLAEQSNNASGSIDETVRILIDNSSKMVEAMLNMQAVIDKQNTHIISTEDTVSDVMEELKGSIEAIRMIENQTKLLEVSRQEIVENIESLSKVAENNVVSTEETSNVITEVSERFQDVQESAVNLRGTADRLVSNIENFKL